jgi:hypothetical protein
MIAIVFVNHDNNVIRTRGFVMEMTRFFSMNILYTAGASLMQIHVSVVLFPISVGFSLGGFHKFPVNR